MKNYLLNEHVIVEPVKDVHIKMNCVENFSLSYLRKYTVNRLNNSAYQRQNVDTIVRELMSRDKTIKSDLHYMNIPSEVHCQSCSFSPNKKFPYMHVAINFSNINNIVNILLYFDTQNNLRAYLPIKGNNIYLTDGENGHKNLHFLGYDIDDDRKYIDKYFGDNAYISSRDDVELQHYVFSNNIEACIREFEEVLSSE